MRRPGIRDRCGVFRHLSGKAALTRLLGTTSRRAGGATGRNTVYSGTAVVDARVARIKRRRVSERIADWTALLERDTRPGFNRIVLIARKTVPWVMPTVVHASIVALTQPFRIFIAAAFSASSMRVRLPPVRCGDV